MLALGATGLGMGLVLPPGRETPAAADQGLDRFLPRYDVNEVNAITIHASPAQVDEAVRSVRASEVRFLSALFWLRSLPATLRGAPAGSAAPGADAATAGEDRALLPAAGEPGPFILLEDQPGREIVIGTIGRFWELQGTPVVELTSPAEFLAFDAPGLAKAALNFRIEERGRGTCRLSTETRVLTLDERDRGRFQLYWKFIHPGSAMLRLSWLQAVKRRAERGR